MKSLTQTSGVHRRLVLLASVLLLVVASPIVVDAQDTATANGPRANRTSGKSATGDPSLAAQFRELQTKVAKLEAALKQKHTGKMSSGMQGGPMSDMMGKGMRNKGGMGKGMGSKGGMGMGSMAGKGASGMGMKSGKKGMMSGQGMGGSAMSGMAMMGQIKGVGKMQMPSALPGFSGASHIYHIGATSFFLDHSQHITLTQKQQVKLNQIKEKVLLDQAKSDRRISQAEQELWVLTSSDAPNAAKIEAKIREVEKLSGDKRIAFIRAVGEAAQVLTSEQRQTLVGMLLPDHKTAGVDNQN